MNDEILKLVLKYAKNKINSINENFRLQDDLGIDSLGWISLIINIETLYGFEFDDEFLIKIDTVKSLNDYVEERLWKNGRIKI